MIGNILTRFEKYPSSGDFFKGMTLNRGSYTATSKKVIHSQ